MLSYSELADYSKSDILLLRCSLSTHVCYVIMLERKREKKRVMIIFVLLK